MFIILMVLKKEGDNYEKNNYFSIDAMHSKNYGPKRQKKYHKKELFAKGK